MAVNCPLEHDEQVYFLREFARLYPGLRIHSIPNAAKRSKWEIRQMLSEGLETGVPDLHVPALDLWIEMKRVRGSKTTPEQLDWISYLESIGDTVIVGKGAADALAKVAAFIQEIQHRAANQ